MKMYMLESRIRIVVPLSPANAIDTWLSDTDLLEQASKLAPSFIAQHHSVEKEAAGIAKVYEGLWNGTRNV